MITHGPYVEHHCGIILKGLSGPKKPEELPGTMLFSLRSYRILVAKILKLGRGRLS
jgi:hypothetical protein